MLKKGEKGGQVTIFIIIAIVIFAGILIFFLLRGSTGISNIPESLQPAYTSFVNCLEESTETGISVVETQGGYIELPEFDPGSEHMPFSSQLDFLGNPIPYWYYVSGNGVPKEQVPSRSDIEDQLAFFINEKVNGCDFSDHVDQGIEISWRDADANVNINDNNVEVDFDVDLSLSTAEESVTVNNVNVEVDSKLGSLHDSALNVYEQEQEDLFLEEYAVDTLRTYAPVDDFEITCSPLTWSADNVFDELQEGIEANTIALNVKNDDYFDVDLSGVDGDVRFINSRRWPNSFEVAPSQGNLLVASPIGNQPGLGALGFCYVSYHFVYDVKYPVLVQVSSGDEIFQFPVAVVLQKNNPREGLGVDIEETAVPELCLYKNTPVSVNVVDTHGTSIDSHVSYECLGNKCDIGQTNGGTLNENFPQCVNGYVSAQADGFKETRILFSTVSSGSIQVVLDKLYTKTVRLNVDSVPYNGNAVINFIPEDSGNTQTISYPEQNTVILSEGPYEIQVYIYQDSSLEIGETTAEQCIEVPNGILGAIGLTKERCFDIEVPSQIISDALSGGGTQSHIILESDLESSNFIQINAGSLPVPKTIDDVQVNHLLFEEKGLTINFA